MTTETSTETQPGGEQQLMATAQELLAARLEAIAPLAQLVVQRKKLLAQLAALEKPYGAAYADALAHGWTPEELRKLDAEEPTKRPPGRPRGRTQKVQKSSPPAPRSPETPSN
ncbi:hypothetical protein [Streptomyces parvus]|uniref:hypothetical protein n=1 Tax=Streptomyces parvus TaxID=66428 RepID=UPI0036782E69